MRYLTLAADFGEVAIRDEQLGALRLHEMRLPDPIASDILMWNGRYQMIIPADAAQRACEPMVSLIQELDRVGTDLARRLAEALGDGAKVKYYSEGRLRHIP